MQRFSGFLMTIALGLSLCVTATPVPAENIRIGILKVASMTPLFVAQDRGYFRDESLSPEIIFFDQPTQIAPGVVSGDLDFALTGFGGALFNLAGQGGLRVIGGTVRETPGFPANATSVSNGAYDKGLRSFKDLGGHATAVDNAGSILTYATWALAQKNGLDYDSLRLLPVGSIPNQISAIIGGRADFALVPNLAIQGALAEHKLHVIGWLGDQIPLQLNVIITSTRTADSRADIVRHFLGALSKGVKDYREAFVGPDEKRQDGPTAAAILEIASKHMNQPPEIVSKGIAYVDPNLRLDPVTFKQLEWFKSRGMVKPEVDASKVIDARYTKSPQ